MPSVIVLPEVLIKNTNKEEQKELVEFFNGISKSSSEDTIITVAEKFERRLSETKADIIKWMFIFWAGQIGILVAVLDLFFKR